MSKETVRVVWESSLLDPLTLTQTSNTASVVYAAKVQHMAASDVMELVDPKILAGLKEKDPHPNISAFVIGHEGTAEGPLLGIGKRIFRYGKKAIEALANSLSVGTKVFSGHGEGTNDHDGRKIVGEVVGRGLKMINDKLTALAAVYTPQEFAGAFDVASMEADLAFNLDAEGVANVTEIKAITGVALGNSEKDKPGFEGATLQGRAQAFAENDPQKESSMSITLKELREIAKGYDPSDIFSDEVLFEDPKVKKNKQSEYEKARRLGEQVGKLKKELQSRDGTAVISEALASADLDDKAKAFLKMNQDSLSFSEDGDPRKEAEAFVASTLKKFDDMRSLFGDKVDDKVDDKADDKDDDEDKMKARKSIPPSDEKLKDERDKKDENRNPEPITIGDFSNPEINPAIPR